MVRLVDVIDVSNILDKYSEFEYDYDHKHNEYILSDADFDELLAKMRNKDYLLQFVVGPEGRSKYSRLHRGSRDTVISAENVEEIEDVEEIIFTESSLLDLLLQIDELNQYDIGLTETVDGNPLLQIGESTYQLNPKSETILDLDEDIIDEISDINEEVYEELADSNEIVEEDVEIEGGLIKEAIKTLAIGGLVRLGKAYLDSDKA